MKIKKTTRHLSFLYFYKFDKDDKIRLQFGFDTSGLDLFFHLWPIWFKINFIFPFTINIFRGFAKTFWYKCGVFKQKDEKLKRGWEIQLFFNDTLDTGISFYKSGFIEAPFFRRKLFSIGILGLILNISTFNKYAYIKRFKRFETDKERKNRLKNLRKLEELYSGNINPFDYGII